MSDRRPISRLAAALCFILLAISFGVRAQNAAPKKSAAARDQKGGAVSPRVSLTPRFIPGQTFRYEMEFETTTETSRSGLASDPQGPSSLVVDWNATVRMEVLPADAGTPGGIRLRTTYEKSTANVHSDTFDPAADETSEQYKSLEGKVVEFTLDAGGKVKYVSGIEGIVDSEKAAQSAREWIAQLSASAGAPPGGVSIGQAWSSEQPANSLPIAGMIWHTDSRISSQRALPPAEFRCASHSGRGGSRSKRSTADGLRRDHGEFESGPLQGGPRPDSTGVPQEWGDIGGEVERLGAKFAVCLAGHWHGCERHTNRDGANGRHAYLKPQHFDALCGDYFDALPGRARRGRFARQIIRRDYATQSHSDNPILQSRLEYRERQTVSRYDVRNGCLARHGADLCGPLKLAFTQAAHRKTAGLRCFAKRKRG